MRETLPITDGAGDAGRAEARDPSGPTVEAVAAEQVLADLADLPYFRVDADRNVVAISPAMERLTGFSADDVLGRSCLTLNRCQECLKGCGVFDHGVVHDVPLRLFTADGSEVEVYKSGQVFRDDEGGITGAVEVVHPVNEQAQGYRSPPPGMDTVLRGLGRQFVLADGDFRVVSHGADLPELMGLPGEELPGTPLARILGDDLFGSGSAFRAALEAGERREGWRGFLVGSGGSLQPVSLTAGPLDPTERCGDARVRYVLMLRPEPRQTSVPSFRGIVSRSPAMQRIFRVVDLLKDNDSTVLVTGESGTGKELLARALHDTSHRSEGPFVAVNCAAIPAELLESELFGHVRGAFTGAVKDRTGRFDMADGGTLFLDEIGDLALRLQAKLLRFLQERTFERVGDSRTRSVDVRVIAATHVDLVQAVAEHRFREDLYYRLRVVPLHIPPLRERREDLELLIRHLLQRIGQERGRSLRLAPSAGRTLLTYAWPGNVRELQNALEYATTVCEGQTIHVADLPAETVPEGGSRAHDPPHPSHDLDASRETHEVERIRLALEQAHYRRGETARVLGMSRTTLWRKMKEYGL